VQLDALGHRDVGREVGHGSHHQRLFWFRLEAGRAQPVGQVGWFVVGVVLPLERLAKAGEELQLCGDLPVRGRLVQVRPLDGVPAVRRRGHAPDHPAAPLVAVAVGARADDVAQLPVELGQTGVNLVEVKRAYDGAAPEDPADRVVHQEGLGRQGIRDNGAGRLTRAQRRSDPSAPWTRPWPTGSSAPDCPRWSPRCDEHLATVRPNAVQASLGARPRLRETCAEPYLDRANGRAPRRPGHVARPRRAPRPGVLAGRRGVFEEVAQVVRNLRARLSEQGR
jgi:hypothetical protein